jgi:cystathionine beta-lyase/cystathionine gamma-synthase
MARPTAGNLGVTTPLVPPLYQSSVYTLPDLDVLDRVTDGAEPGYIYARDGHPNASRLAERLAELEGAAWGLITASGMAAITTAFLGSLNQGERVVAGNRLYGRTVQLLTQQLRRFGVHTDFVDVNNLDEVRTALLAPAQVLYVETISNPLLRVPDLAALGEIARGAGCRLVVDNTFATPTLARPLDLGADLVMESLTKMIGGHGDVTLGFLAGSDAKLAGPLGQLTSIWGLASNPFDCWLAERGLSTLSLRVRTASANAAALADWLSEQPGVCRVLYPGRPDHPDHAVAQRILRGGFGNMLCFELEGGREAVNRFLRRAPGVPFSPSLGHTTTTCSHPASTSHRYVSAPEKQRQGITDGLLRLSVGVEDLEEIRRELERGLAKPI